MTQVFVVTAAGSVIAFIARDIGDSSTSGWIIQVRLFGLFHGPRVLFPNQPQLTLSPA